MKFIGEARNDSVVVDLENEVDFNRLVDEKAADWSAEGRKVKWRGPGRYIIACVMLDSEFVDWYIPFDDTCTFALVSARIGETVTH
jgi:hypothetical protein